MTVAPVSEAKLKDWYKISLTSKNLLLNGQTERLQIKILTQGTCTADTILQALRWQYIDDEHFRKTIDGLIRKSDDADLPRFIASSVEGGITRQTYRWRRELTTKQSFIRTKDDVKFIHPSSSVFDLLQEFVTPLFPSMTSTTGCKCKIKRTFVTLPVEHSFIFVYGASFLQLAIDDRVNSEMILCKRCGESKPDTHVFGAFVFVTGGAVENEKVTMKKEKQLGNIPKQIDLRGKKYGKR